MTRRTTAILAILGAVGAGAAAYFLRGKAPSLRFLAAGAAFALPWGVHAALASVVPSCVFLFITDTHGSAAANRKLVDALLTEQGVAFVAHGGDVADAYWSSWWDEAFRAVRERWPVYAASGNHDVETANSSAEFTARFGELPRSVRCGDTELFFVPWGLTRESAERLWSMVGRSDAPVKILVTHKPVWPVHDDDVRRRELLMPILDRIDLILSGHDHVYQDRMVDGERQIIEVSGPKKYPCPPDAAGCVENSTGYLRVEVYGSTIRVLRRTV